LDLLSIALNKFKDLIQITRNLKKFLKNSVKYSNFSLDFECCEL
jgi:hypothetical protein